MLLYQRHRGKKQIVSNLQALVSFLSNLRGVKPIIVVTPLMRNKFFKEIVFLYSIIESKGGQFFITRHPDPDQDIITTAIDLHAYILSNDKYRDYPEFSDYIDAMRMPFKIRDGKILLEVS